MAYLRDLLVRAAEVWDGKYDYSLITDNGQKINKNKDKFRIICPEHGVFEKTFYKHIDCMQGCPECSGKKRYSTEEFIRKARLLPNAEGLTFEKTEYKGNKEHVICTCHKRDNDGNEHGDFRITPGHLLSGQGCPKCRHVKSSASRRKSLSEIIAMANEVHGGYYDYSLMTEYKNRNTKYPIKCPVHGVFLQTMGNHINGGQGCPKCGRERSASDRTLSFGEFVERAREVHGDRYEYVEDTWVNTSSKVGIICKEHGLFMMDANNHIFLGHNCPKCSYLHSEGENEIYDFIAGLIGKGKVRQRDRSVLENGELDIYIPSLRIAFEYNGLYWHSEERKPNDYHLRKTESCKEKGIRLIHIFEDEWRDKKDIIKSMIRYWLNATERRVMSRKCEVREITYSNSKRFLDGNHLQGSCNSRVRIGLFHDDELVSVMTFGKTRHFVGNNRFEWELLRFCNKTDTVVSGGAGRLLSFFVRKYKPKSIVSYADRRWSVGNLYESLGFSLYNTSRPNYYYIVNRKREYRFNLRKQVLMNRYGCPKDKTERDFCREQGWLRIYDCGCLCYKMEFRNQ